MKGEAFVDEEAEPLCELTVLDVSADTVTVSVDEDLIRLELRGWALVVSIVFAEVLVVVEALVELDVLDVENVRSTLVVKGSSLVWLDSAVDNELVGCAVEGFEVEVDDEAGVESDDDHVSGWDDECGRLDDKGTDLEIDGVDDMIFDCDGEVAGGQKVDLEITDVIFECIECQLDDANVGIEYWGLEDADDKIMDSELREVYE